MMRWSNPYVEVDTQSSLISNKKRGLIVSNQIDGNVFDSRPIPEDTLRMIVLFYDMIDLPFSPEEQTSQAYKAFLEPRSISKRYQSRSADESFLINCGLITNSYIIPRNGYSGYGSEHRFGLEVFDYREKEEPGLWSLSNIIGTRPYPTENGNDRAISLKLFDALPIPNRDVPLEDCLKFKEKHYDELIAIRSYVGELCGKIQSSSDVNWAINDEVTNLKKGCEDYISAMKNWPMPYIQKHFEFDVSLMAGASAMVMTNPNSTPYILGSFATAKIIQVGIATKSPNPFAYMWSMQNI